MPPSMASVKANIIGFSHGACTTLEIAIHHGSFIGERMTLEAGSPMPGITAGIIKTFLDSQPWKA